MGLGSFYKSQGRYARMKWKGSSCVSFYRWNNKLSEIIPCARLLYNSTTFSSQDFFSGGGDTFSKKFKNFLKNYQKNFNKISQNILKIFIRKLIKMHYFSRFFTKFKKPCANFWRVWTKKTVYWKFWENFLKFWKRFLKKIAKNSLF